jgi:hypothetical protein
MGRQWERQLLLPFSFYIGAKVLLFFELAKFNLECEPHGQKCGTGGAGETGGTSGTGDTGGTSGTGETGGKIIRLSFAYPSLIVRLLFTLLILFSLYCFLRFFNFYIF